MNKRLTRVLGEYSNARDAGADRKTLEVLKENAINGLMGEVDSRTAKDIFQDMEQGYRSFIW